jgi:hypothetical protein
MEVGAARCGEGPRKVTRCVVDGMRNPAIRAVLRYVDVVRYTVVSTDSGR